jgi:hypothetical protein
MTADDFITKSDPKQYGQFYLLTHQELTQLLDDFARQPCTCTGNNYTYGHAKCLDCGRFKIVDEFYPEDKF